MVKHSQLTCGPFLPTPPDYLWNLLANSNLVRSTYLNFMETEIKIVQKCPQRSTKYQIRDALALLWLDNPHTIG